MANVGGVFAVLISGAGFAMFIALLEVLLAIRRRATELEVITHEICKKLIRSSSIFISALLSLLLHLTYFRCPSSTSSSMSWNLSASAAIARERWSEKRRRQETSRWSMSRDRCRDQLARKLVNWRGPTATSTSVVRVWRTWKSWTWCRSGNNVSWEVPKAVGQLKAMMSKIVCYWVPVRVCQLQLPVLAVMSMSWDAWSKSQWWWWWCLHWSVCVRVFLFCEKLFFKRQMFPCHKK